MHEVCTITALLGFRENIHIEGSEVPFPNLTLISSVILALIPELLPVEGSEGVAAPILLQGQVPLGRLRGQGGENLDP